jgi:hypothetical protein
MEINNELRIPIKFDGDINYEWIGDFIVDLDKDQNMKILDGVD